MLKIHFRSVGIGDNIILEFPNGRVGIVDCNRCWRECLDFLEGQLHAEELEFVVGSRIPAKRQYEAERSEHTPILTTSEGCKTSWNITKDE